MKLDYILVIIYYGIFLQYSNQTVISSFYPQYAKNKYGMSQISIGFVFSAQSVGVFITSISIMKYMSKPGMKKIFVISSIFLTAFSHVMQGLTHNIDDLLTFEIMSIAARIILGIGTGLLTSPIYSYLTILYQDTMAEKIGWIEFYSGLGASFGPMMRGLLYQYGGYTLPYIVSFGLGLILIPLSFIYLPSDEKIISNNDIEMSDLSIKLLDKIDDNSMSQAIQDQKHEKKIYDIPFLQLFIYFDINPHKYWWIFRFMFRFYNCNFLEDQYGFSESLVGLTFLCGCIGYLIFVPLTVKITTKITKIRWLLFIGILIIGFALWIIGHSLSIPDHFIFPQLGMLLLNLGTSLIHIPAFPDLVATLKFQYSDYPDEIIGDICSTIYNNSCALGSFIGPLVGGSLEIFFSFKTVNFYMGNLILGYAIIYLFIGVKQQYNVINFKTDQIAISQQEVYQKILKRIPSLNKKISRSLILIRLESYSSINLKQSPQSVDIPKTKKTDRKKTSL